MQRMTKFVEQRRSIIKADEGGVSFAAFDEIVEAGRSAFSVFSLSLKQALFKLYEKNLD